MHFTDLFWLYLIVATLLPALQRRWLDIQRFQRLQLLESRRQSRLITLIHRQETIGFLGIPLARYIDIEDSEAILAAIRLTPDSIPIDIVLHTPGGLALAAEQIAEALKKHPARVNVLVTPLLNVGGNAHRPGGRRDYPGPECGLGTGRPPGRRVPRRFDCCSGFSVKSQPR